MGDRGEGVPIFDVTSCFPIRVHTHTHTHTQKTTTEDDNAATLHHTCILNSFIYLCWVSVEVLTAFLVGINGGFFSQPHAAVVEESKI